MIGFFVFKIAFAVCKQLTFHVSKTYTISQSVLDAAMIVLIIVFNSDANRLSYVVAASCTIDVLTNIAKAIAYRKGKDSESFFGMENIICILFILLFFVNSNGDAANILFGTLILYKGAASILSNRYIKKFVSLSDLGKALNRVHGIDVLFGLFIILMLTSFILPYVEAEAGGTITEPGLALWYCFEIITTIGFGDLVAISSIGRILSVIIGFYGIIIVSLLTSSIVVYISEENKKEEEKEKGKKFDAIFEDIKGGAVENPSAEKVVRKNIAKKKETSEPEITLFDNVVEEVVEEKKKPASKKEKAVKEEKKVEVNKEPAKEEKPIKATPKVAKKVDNAESKIEKPAVEKPKSTKKKTN